MVGQNPEKNQPEFLVVLRSHALPLQRIGTMVNPAPSLQFLWLPLDVISLCSRFQACFFQNQEEFGVLEPGITVRNQSVGARRRGRALANFTFLLNILLSV